MISHVSWVISALGYIRLRISFCLLNQFFRMYFSHASSSLVRSTLSTTFKYHLPYIWTLSSVFSYWNFCHIPFNVNCSKTICFSFSGFIFSRINSISLFSFSETWRCKVALLYQKDRNLLLSVNVSPGYGQLNYGTVITWLYSPNLCVRDELRRR